MIETRKRKLEVWEHLEGKLYWRTTCEHKDGRADTLYSEEEAKARCDELKREGTKFIVKELVNVTKEFL